MMKTTVLTIVAIAATIALTSCNKEDNGSIEVSKYITIDAGVGSLTRATSTAFVSGDQLSVYSWTGSNTSVQTPLLVDNSINTYDGTKWTAVPQMLWEDNTTVHYFLSVHPTKAITNFTADSYATTPDLLVATVLGEGRKATEGIVPLVFDHVMAKLVVNLTFRTQFDETSIIESVTTNARPGATVNYLTKTTTPDGTAATITLSAITAKTTFQGFLAPQTVNTIKINIDGKAYTYTHPTDITLVSGKIQTVNLIVGRDAIVLGSITVNDWGAGETIDGGEALD